MQAEVQSRTLTMPSLRRALRNEAFRAPDIWWFLALVPPPICSLPLGSKTSKNSFFFYPIPITYPASRKESKLIVLTMAASCGTLRTKSGALRQDSIQSKPLTHGLTPLGIWMVQKTKVLYQWKSMESVTEVVWS